MKAATDVCSLSVQPILALLGLPVSGNPSQYVMEKAFAHHALDWRYISLEVTPDGLGDAVRGFRALGFHGGHVARPTRRRSSRCWTAWVRPLRRSARSTASRGRTARWWATTSRGLPFWRVCAANSILREKHVVVAGTGRMARAVVFALAEEKPAELLDRGAFGGVGAGVNRTMRGHRLDDGPPRPDRRCVRRARRDRRLHRRHGPRRRRSRRSSPDEPVRNPHLRRGGGRQLCPAANVALADGRRGAGVRRSRGLTSSSSVWPPASVAGPESHRIGTSCARRRRNFSKFESLLSAPFCRREEPSPWPGRIATPGGKQLQMSNTTSRADALDPSGRLGSGGNCGRFMGDGSEDCRGGEPAAGFQQLCFPVLGWLDLRPRSDARLERKRPHAHGPGGAAPGCCPATRSAISSCDSVAG